MYSFVFYFGSLLFVKVGNRSKTKLMYVNCCILRNKTEERMIIIRKVITQKKSKNKQSACFQRGVAITTQFFQARMHI